MYPPGMHGKKYQRRLSEYGQQLQSKQKVKQTYRMMEKQFKNWVKDAIKSKQETGEFLVKKLENRLDNVIYRAGLAQSRDQARQVVNHGHILVNGRKINLPSYEVKMGDTLQVKEGSLKSPYFSIAVQQWIKRYEPPKWIELDKDNFKIKVSGLPTVQDSGLENKDVRSLIEFYSR
jgi:small subunit ribosomal protein S4